MKIIAKQGSELEKLLKQMNERLLREQDEKNRPKITTKEGKISL